MQRVKRLEIGVSSGFISIVSAPLSTAACGILAGIFLVIVIFPDSALPPTGRNPALHRKPGPGKKDNMLKILHLITSRFPEKILNTNNFRQNKTSTTLKINENHRHEPGSAHRKHCRHNRNNGCKMTARRDIIHNICA